MRSEFPTIDEIDTATEDQIRTWYRKLPIARNHDELRIVNMVVDRYRKIGGMTSEASKRIGWDP